MTPRERFRHALDRKPPIPGMRVPHFELVFFLTMEAFGRVHPSHRNYSQWLQMERKEQELHLLDQARIYINTAERFGQDAILLLPNPNEVDTILRLCGAIRELSGDKFFLLAHGDATPAIPGGTQMEELALQMAEDPAGLEREIEKKMGWYLDRGEKLAKQGYLDGFALCCDYCFNSGPFFTPAQFGQFVMPCLARQIADYRSMGFYCIKHTDGNIMPILDQLVQANPHALHSLDPQGGVDIAVVKKACGDRVALCGNVNCGLMDTGTDEQVIESARYALKHGMPGGGYVFCTSNCIYTGMALRRYELILDVWRREGNYQ